MPSLDLAGPRWPRACSSKVVLHTVCLSSGFKRCLAFTQCATPAHRLATALRHTLPSARSSRKRGPCPARSNLICASAVDAHKCTVPVRWSLQRLAGVAGGAALFQCSQHRAGTRPMPCRKAQLNAPAFREAHRSALYQRLQVAGLVQLA